jgi:hypothetical protein
MTVCEITYHLRVGVSDAHLVTLCSRVCAVPPFSVVAPCGNLPVTLVGPCFNYFHVKE